MKKLLLRISTVFFIFHLLPVIAAEKPDSARSLKIAESHLSGYKSGFVLREIHSDETVSLHPEITATRFSPCSTFKIPNSLIGLETGVIPNVDTVWKWDGVKRFIPEWNQDQTMRSAFKFSCVPYYQDLAEKVGPERMKSFITKLHYGNEDISGRQTKFWLQSTLKISANEQVDFLRKLALNELPFSQRSMDLVKEIMIVPLESPSVLRGKTGTGADKNGNYNFGWFVGYVTTGDKVYAFATVLVEGPNASGPTAKRLTIEILKDLALL